MHHKDETQERQWYVAYCIHGDWGRLISDPTDEFGMAQKFIDDFSDGCEYWGIVSFYTLAEAMDYQKNGRPF